MTPGFFAFWPTGHGGSGKPLPVGTRVSAPVASPQSRILRSGVFDFMPILCGQV